MGSRAPSHGRAAPSPFPVSRANRSRIIVPPPTVIRIPGVRVARIVAAVGTVVVGIIVPGAVMVGAIMPRAVPPAISAPAPMGSEGDAHANAAVSVSVAPGIVPKRVVPGRSEERTVGPLRAPAVVEPVEIPAISVGTAVDVPVAVVAFRYDRVLGAFHHFHVIRVPFVLLNGAQLRVTTGQQRHKQRCGERRRA